MFELEFTTSEAIEILKPLAVLLGEITAYAIFVFVFYRFMARRDIITANLSRQKQAGYRFIGTIYYVIRHILFFPILIICWTAVLVVILSLLGKDQQPENVLLVSVALISTIRTTAYISEDLSKDLAKMLPFAILGLYLVNKSYLSLSVTSGILDEIPEYWEIIVYYIVFVVALELVLRILYGIVSCIKAPPRPSKKQLVSPN